jgi:hypothetical protein
MTAVPAELLQAIANPQGGSNVLEMFMRGNQQRNQNEEMGWRRNEHNALLSSGKLAALGNFQGAAAQSFATGQHQIGREYISMYDQQRRDAQLQKMISPEMEQGPRQPNAMSMVPPAAPSTGDSYEIKMLRLAKEALKVGNEKLAQEYYFKAQEGKAVARPMTAEEKKYWGYKPDDAVWLDSNNEPHAPPAGTNITIDQKGLTAEEESAGKERGTRMDLLESGKSTSSLQQIQLAGKLLQNVDSGALAGMKGTAGNIFTSLGLPVEGLKYLGIDPNLVTTGPQIQALINRQVVGMIGSGQFPAQNFSDTDRIFLEKILPSLANQPEANALITATTERLLQIEGEKRKAWTQARKQNVSFRDFEADWNDRLAGTDLFGDIAKQAGADQQGDDQGWAPVPGMPGVTIRPKGQ